MHYIEIIFPAVGLSGLMAPPFLGAGVHQVDSQVDQESPSSCPTVSDYL